VSSNARISCIAACTTNSSDCTTRTVPVALYPVPAANGSANKKQTKKKKKNRNEGQQASENKHKNTTKSNKNQTPETFNRFLYKGSDTNQTNPMGTQKNDRPKKNVQIFTHSRSKKKRRKKKSTKTTNRQEVWACCTSRQQQKTTTEITTQQRLKKMATKKFPSLSFRFVLQLLH
jgi:hypothetical protein